MWNYQWKTGHWDGHFGCPSQYHTNSTPHSFIHSFIHSGPLNKKKYIHHPETLTTHTCAHIHTHTHIYVGVHFVTPALLSMKKREEGMKKKGKDGMKGGRVGGT